MTPEEQQLYNSGWPIKIGQEEYTASVLTDQDYGDLNNYLQARYVQLAKGIARSMDDDARREIISIALKDAMRITWGTEEGNEILWTEDGILHLGYQMIRRRHPNVPFSKFKAHYDSDKVAASDEIFGAHMKLNLKQKEEGDAQTGQNKSNSDKGGIIRENT